MAENRLKRKIKFYLDDSKTLTGKVFGLVFVALNILACALFVIDTYLDNANMALSIAENVVVSLFVLEYILRFWVSKSKIKYIFSFYAIIDILSILPSVISLQNLRFLRGFKVLRILRFLRFLETEEFFFGNISKIKLQAIKTIFITFTILFISASFIHYAETASVISKIQTFGDAFYYSVITLSTVGFGDLVPITDLGRFFTVVMILGGAILIPWQAGKLVNMLVKEDSDNSKIKCNKCGLTRHDLDASHCKACGAVIYQEYEG